MKQWNFMVMIICHDLFTNKYEHNMINHGNDLSCESCFMIVFFWRPWFTRVSLPFSNYPPAKKWIRYGKRSISRSLSQNQMENVWKSPHLCLVTGFFKATNIGGRPSSNSCRRRWWGNPPNYRPPAGFFHTDGFGFGSTAKECGF